MNISKVKYALLEQARERLEELFEDLGEEELEVLAVEGDNIELHVGPLDCYDLMED